MEYYCLGLFLTDIMGYKSYIFIRNCISDKTKNMAPSWIKFENDQ